MPLTPSPEITPLPPIPGGGVPESTEARHERRASSRLMVCAHATVADALFNADYLLYVFAPARASSEIEEIDVVRVATSDVFARRTHQAGRRSCRTPGMREHSMERQSSIIPEGRA